MDEKKGNRKRREEVGHGRPGEEETKTSMDKSFQMNLLPPNCLSPPPPTPAVLPGNRGFVFSGDSISKGGLINSQI